jgi:hypothetical protein
MNDRVHRTVAFPLCYRTATVRERTVATISLPPPTSAYNGSGMRRFGIERLLPFLFLVWGSLIFPMAAVTWAQPLNAPKTIFPSDSEDPRQAGGAERLEAVCPGRVASGKELRCRIVCPKFTGFAGDDLGWSLARVTRGHFLSPTSEDAALSMEGCESHSLNFGGTILLTRGAQRWTMLWYKGASKQRSATEYRSGADEKSWCV